MNARQQAYTILCGVMIHGQYANLALRKLPEDLDGRDLGLITRIVYGTLQNDLYVRWIWQHHVKKNPPEAVAVLLDMSTFQLALMDKLPAYAVISEAVEIAKTIKQDAYSGLVNAVLRKVAAQPHPPILVTDPVKKLSLQTSHPEWLIRLWKAHYGWDTTCQICQEDLKTDCVALRVNTLKTSREKLLENSDFTAGPLPQSLFYQGDILHTRYFKNHLVDVQSLSSQQAVDWVKATSGEKIIDMCAAPGTKTIQMAIGMKDNGSITAVDIHPQRVELIEKSVKAHDLHIVSVICADSTKLDLPTHRYDKVLLDAPCSGLGTLKNKAEIKRNLKPEDLDQLVILQSQLLDSAAKMVAEGGQLIYSTCTLDKKENERQIASFINRHPEFKLDDQLTMMPMDLSSDGFYVARLFQNSTDMVK